MNSKEIKRLGFRVFWGLEILFFIFFYIFSKNGLAKIRRLEIINNNIERDITTIKEDINNLNLELIDWDSNSFYKEKIARQDLQMAYPDEEIFLIK